MSHRYSLSDFCVVYIFMQSTIVNILNTYGLRHNLTISPKGAKNSLCHFIDKCAKELNLDLEASTETTSKLKKIKLRAIDSSDLSRHADISVMHHLCDVSGHTTQAALPCAFRSHKSAKRTPIKQITVVREPLSRALSVYYFWGELFKLKEISRSSDKKVANIFCAFFPVLTSGESHSFLCLLEISCKQRHRSSSMESVYN